MRCWRCGSPMAWGARFCSSCAAPAGGPRPEPKKRSTVGLVLLFLAMFAVGGGGAAAYFFVPWRDYIPAGGSSEAGAPFVASGPVRIAVPPNAPDGAKSARGVVLDPASLAKPPANGTLTAAARLSPDLDIPEG